jgi:nucleoid-associated protein YgaU
MSRGMLGTVRPYAVWLGVTVVAAAAASSVPGAWRATAGGTGSEQAADAVVAGCATLLALSLAWLWLVTSVTVVELVAGREPRGRGATRRLVLLACGAAVVAGTALPAQAAGGDGAEVLVGLPLPERPVAPAPAPRAARATASTAPTAATGTPSAPSAPATPVTRPTAPDTYVVRAGDSLWSIARAHPAPDADVASRWRAIWRHNHDVVGDDPDLIHPGQALHLPDTDTDEDGERR